MLLKSARDRVLAALETITRLYEIEFPYADSKLALDHIRQELQSELVKIDKLDSSSDTALVRQQCSLALRVICRLLPLTGFVIRSTDIRNAFEFYGPLLRLSRSILSTIPGSDAEVHLVLSSEWEYSPLTIVTGIPNFVLIGVPASESSNALLLPLAGHELGHTVWSRSGLCQKLSGTLRQKIVDLIRDDYWTDFQQHFSGIKEKSDLDSDMLAVQSWQPVLRSALEQCEEVFCDAFGIRLFGASFLYAFAYLLSPKVSGQRDISYPSMKTRVRYQTQAARSYSVVVPDGYDELFEDDTAPTLSDADSFRLRLADSVTDSQADDLAGEATEIASNADVALPSDGEIEQIVSRFRQVVPAEKCSSLQAIVSAAWQAHLDDSLWQESRQLRGRKAEVLNELVLKNIEVLEYLELLEQGQS